MYCTHCKIQPSVPYTASCVLYTLHPVLVHSYWNLTGLYILYPVESKLDNNSLYCTYNVGHTVLRIDVCIYSVCMVLPSTRDV